MEATERSGSSRRLNAVPRQAFRSKWGFIVLALLVLASYPPLINLSYADLQVFIFPWVDEIRSIGIARFIAGSDSNYTPPYIYLLYLVSILPGPENTLLYVKILSIAGTGCLCACLYRFFSFFLARNQAWLCAAGVFVLPTAVLNSVAWGQCDAFYTAAVVLAVAEGIRNNLIRMMLAVGVAFAFKAQAVFIFPFVLYFLISRKMNPGYLLIPAAVYMIFVLPAWIAGRPLHDLVMIYYNQAGFYNLLSMSAPNPWTIVQYHLPGIVYKVATPAGMLAALAAGVALAYWAAREKIATKGLVELAVASLILIPFLLPKMHERYFFPADVLCYAFALVYSRTWVLALAILIQLGSISAYSVYLTMEKVKYGAHFGAVFVTIAVLLIGYQLRQSWRVSEPASSH